MTMVSKSHILSRSSIVLSMEARTLKMPTNVAPAKVKVMSVSANRPFLRKMLRKDSSKGRMRNRRANQRFAPDSKRSIRPAPNRPLPNWYVLIASAAVMRRFAMNGYKEASTGTSRPMTICSAMAWGGVRISVRSRLNQPAR